MSGIDEKNISLERLKEEIGELPREVVIDGIRFELSGVSLSFLPLKPDEEDVDFDDLEELSDKLMKKFGTGSHIEGNEYFGLWWGY